MMRKKISWLFLLTVFLSFCLHSCRTEDFMEQQTQKQTANYKVYMIDKKQLTADFELFSRLAQIQEVFSERKTNAKTTQDGLLDGAVIGISKVLVVEDENRQKTYTFPLKKIYPSNKIENLVLKRNPDSTFSGMLVQYDLTAQQKDLFNRWHTIDLKSKTEIYDINNLHINTQARIVNYQIGCLNISYEDGKCASACAHTDPSQCQLSGANAPQPPRILSITAIPGCGGSDGGIEWPQTGTGSYPVGTGSNTSAGGGDANTMMFDEYDLTYYNSDDMTDPDFIFWSRVNQFIQAQPQIVKNFNNEYHYVFYFVHTFFKANGMTDANKLFVSQRLQQIAQWYYDPTTGTYLDYNQKLAVAILAVKYMLENPTVTWEEYRNQFLTSPCEKAVNEANKAKEIVTNATLNNKIAGIKPSIASDTTEKGFNFGKNTSGNYAVSGTYTGTLTGLSMPSTETDFTPSGSFHTHPGYEGYECFSAADFYQLYVKNKENGNFTTLFVLTATGGIYNLMITDYAKFNSFLTNLPISLNIDPQEGHWKEGTDIGKDFEDVKDKFKDQGKTEDEAFALAHAYVLQKYNTGMTISKQDSSGNFKPVFVKETKDPTDPNKTNYELTQDCNL
ncbi:hypothetical protein [Chryseobacterium nepalense]|uniref:hypothetical protein n=1 Tax=Chryseobacterium nepalense TaxID=1854498 RepID=UPI002E08737E|nr:hypothetical protein [Chryseobacterium nepalense]